jgi:hypothetical protein
MASSYIQTAVVAYLKTVDAITDILGTRIYHLRAPENATLPYATVRVVSPDNQSTIFGEPETRFGTHQIQVMVSGVGMMDAPPAMQAAHEVVKSLLHYSGSMDGITVRSITDMAGPQEIVDETTDDRVDFVVQFVVEFEETT